MKKKNIIEFEQVVERGCGMDVHKDLIVTTIQGKGIKMQTKSCNSFTSSLIKLKGLLIFLAFLVNYEVSAINKFKPEDFGIPLEQVTSGPNHIWNLFYGSEVYMSKNW